jgi:hypothetical protein
LLFVSNGAGKLMWILYFIGFALIDIIFGSNLGNFTYDILNVKIGVNFYAILKPGSGYT